MMMSGREERHGAGSMNKTNEYELEEYGKDILESDNFKKIAAHVQHGTMSVQEHCINVAKTSVMINRKLHANCNEKDLVRGALLHDYFLYDWHKGDPEDNRLHGFAHPGKALRNAKKEYDLTDRQEDIIKKHMWPLTVVPPLCREAWIVTAADKYCSTLETFRLQKGRRERRRRLIKKNMKNQWEDFRKELKHHIS